MKKIRAPIPIFSGVSKIALLIAIQAVICISTYNVFSGVAGVSLSLLITFRRAGSRGQRSTSFSHLVMKINPINTHLVLSKDRAVLHLLVEYLPLWTSGIYIGYHVRAQLLFQLNRDPHRELILFQYGLESDSECTSSSTSGTISGYISGQASSTTSSVNSGTTSGCTSGTTSACTSGTTSGCTSCYDF